MNIAGIFSKQQFGFPSEIIIVNKRGYLKKLFCPKMFGWFESVITSSQFDDFEYFALVKLGIYKYCTVLQPISWMNFIYFLQLSLDF